MNLPRRLSVACVLAFSLLSLPSPAQEDAPDPGPDPSQPVSYQAFYDALAGSGRWVTVSGYGSCWQPTGVDADWAPYVEGYWTYTEDGWTWVSDEPWGWAVYHYGRWLLTPRGWFWVPGYTWGPCWVRWRYGNGYCGWAPLPPQGVAIGYAWYNFCRVNDIGLRRMRDGILERGGNGAYFGQTSGGFHRGGPAIDEINDNAFRKVPRLSLHRTAGAVPARPRQVGGQLHVYAPAVQPPATAAPWHPTPAPRHPGAPSRSDRPYQPNPSHRPDDRGGSRPDFHPAPAPRPQPAPAPAPQGIRPSGGGGSALNPPWLHH